MIGPRKELPELWTRVDYDYVEVVEFLFGRNKLFIVGLMLGLI